MLGLSSASRQDPDHDRDHRYEDRELERAAAIAAPLTNVVPRDQRRRREDRQDDDLDDRGAQRRPRGIPVGGCRAGLRRPGRDLLEVHRTSAIRGRLDSEPLVRHPGKRTRPRGPCVGVLPRRPFRCRRRKRCHVESGSGEQRAPVGGCRLRCRLHLRRNHVQLQQPSLRIQLQHRHPRHRQWRIGRDTRSLCPNGNMTDGLPR